MVCTRMSKKPSGEDTCCEIHQRARETLRNTGQYSNTTKSSKAAYDDTRDGNEGQDECHVCLRPAERIVDRECVNRIPAAKDRNEQQTLQTHISKVSLPGRRNRRRM